MMTDSEGLPARMKRYEAVSYHTLTRRVPVILRVDGRAFHTLTRSLEGWSTEFSNKIAATAVAVMQEMQGCAFAYCQSDEISFLLTDYQTIKTQPWFNYELEKIISISAAIASVSFSLQFGSPAEFDSRAFSVPQDEACNYFIWRQQDATRNAINMVGQQHFSPKQLHGKSTDDVQEMLFQEKAIKFNDYTAAQKRGVCVVRGEIDKEIPIFTQDRKYVEKHVFIREN